MEKVIKESLKKLKDLERLKIRIFSKTLNLKYNLNKKELLIFHMQPFISNNYTKERLTLKEDIFSNKLSENIDIYYEIKQSKENLKQIIKKKNKYNNKYNNIFPNYISLDKYTFEKMIDYRKKKQKEEYKLYIINKAKEKQKKEKEKNVNKRLSYFIQPNYDFIDSIRNEGIKTFNRRTSKKLSLIRKKREKKIVKNFVLLKEEMFKENKKYKELMEKRENKFLIKNLENSVNKIRIYYNNLKKKSANKFYIALNKIIQREKYNLYKQFISRLIIINNISKREKKSFVKTMIIIPQKKYFKTILNRYSLMERRSIIPKLFNELDKDNLNEKNKIKFRPNYLFDKRNNKEENDFNKFFKDWNNNRNKQMIDDIYKYTLDNFNIHHNILFTQINKLIKNNKIENLEKEVHKSKNDTKRNNTISNTKAKSANIRLKKYIKDNSKTNHEKKKKILLNLKYQL